VGVVSIVGGREATRDRLGWEVVVGFRRSVPLSGCPRVPVSW
jgi:hypothetical protein